MSGTIGNLPPQAEPVALGPAWLLSVEPPVFLAGIPFSDYLGLARPFAASFGDINAGFIIFPTWSIEKPGVAEAIARHYAQHRSAFPRHRFRFICNTAEEFDLLRRHDLPALFLNKNFTVSEKIFHPLPEASVDLDAVYNARFVAGKRHELARLIDRVGYITYVEPVEPRHVEFREINAAIARHNRGHVLLNHLQNGLPVAMSKAQVNAAMARASVGLVLSDVEGSSYCSMEYLLAGLPVVSTPSRGGRDVFFDPDYCIICEPDPVAVRLAVEQLQARNLPREEIRNRTLEKIAPLRRRFVGLVDELLAEMGALPRLSGLDYWPFAQWSGVQWSPYSTHLEIYMAARRVGLARRLGLPPQLMADIQLSAEEIVPIVATILARPGCRLLVFGCGNDSPFWEAVNATGTTAFIEDDPEWAKVAQGRLKGSAVHLVDYDCRLAQWPALLDQPERLNLTLPEAVEQARWDVILVDGPAGYQPDNPGRMKSIYAASRLIAGDGVVFVHDCNRPAEAAYAQRYLGKAAHLIEASGRALLRGYVFEP